MENPTTPTTDGVRGRLTHFFNVTITNGLLFLYPELGHGDGTQRAILFLNNVQLPSAQSADSCNCMYASVCLDVLLLLDEFLHDPKQVRDDLCLITCSYIHRHPINTKTPCQVLQVV